MVEKLSSDLQFNLVNVIRGVNRLVIRCTKQDGLLGAEFMLIDDNGKIREITCHYLGELK